MSQHWASAGHQTAADTAAHSKNGPRQLCDHLIVQHHTCSPPTTSTVPPQAGSTRRVQPVAHYYQASEHPSWFWLLTSSQKYISGTKPSPTNGSPSFRQLLAMACWLRSTRSIPILDIVISLNPTTLFRILRILQQHPPRASTQDVLELRYNWEKSSRTTMPVISLWEGLPRRAARTAARGCSARCIVGHPPGHEPPSLDRRRWHSKHHLWRAWPKAIGWQARSTWWEAGFDCAAAGHRVHVARLVGNLAGELVGLRTSPSFSGSTRCRPVSTAPEELVIGRLLEAHDEVVADTRRSDHHPTRADAASSLFTELKCSWLYRTAPRTASTNDRCTTTWLTRRARPLLAEAEV